MRTHATASAAALLLLAACTPDFVGPEQVTGLRLLAVQAEPPELGAAGDGSGPSWPASAATLRSLVGHPGFAVDGATRAVVLHLACTPTPGDLAGTVCTQMSALTDPSQLLQHLDVEHACSAPGQGAVDAITFSGLEACDRTGCGPFSVLRDPADAGSSVTLPSPTYALPAGYALASLPAGHVQRVLGLDVVDLALVLEATPADLAPAAPVPDACAALGAVLQAMEAAWPSRPGVTAVKWVHVRGPDMPADSPPNHDPAVSGATLGGAPLPAPGGTPLAVQAGQAQDLLPVLPGAFQDLRERYQRFDTEARYLDTRDEDWAYSWFTTAGDLDQAHTQSWDEPDAFKPKAGRAVLWLVVRDLRGGTSWTAGEVEGQ